MPHFSQDVLADAHTLFECPHPRRRSPAKIEKKIIKLKDIGALKFNNLNIQNRRAGGKKPRSKYEKQQLNPHVTPGIEPRPQRFAWRRALSPLYHPYFLMIDKLSFRLCKDTFLSYWATFYNFSHSYVPILFFKDLASIIGFPALGIS